MDGRHDPLSDAALDRELGAALNAEPSPEFVARVRMRVAEQPVAAGWWPRWGMATAGIGAMALVVAVGLWSMDEPVPTAQRIARDISLRPAIAEPAPPLVATRAVVPVVLRPRQPARVENGRREIVLDDVIVSAEDRRGFEALLVAIEERRLPVLPREEPGTDSGTPAPIEIPDVTIEPLELLRLE